MNNLLAQLVLARRDDGDGWMNILVVVVMAVIWMVGAIVKSTKTKPGEKQQPSRKPPAHSRGVQQQMPERAQRPAGPPQRPGPAPDAPKRRTTLADLREAARKFATEAEQAFQVQTAKPRPPEQVAKPHIQPEITPHIEPVTEPIKGLGDLQPAAAEMPATQHLSELLSDYADPDKLRRAILHYEILGPPLSLRD
jgi:hypothetical protein